MGISCWTFQDLQWTEKLKDEPDTVIQRFCLDYMITMMYGLTNSSHQNQVILRAYHTRGATWWSKEEQHNARQRYDYRIRKHNILVDELDEEFGNQMRMGLNTKAERDIMQKIAFIDKLINQLKHFTDEYNRQYLHNQDNDININNSDISNNKNNITYPVETRKYSKALARGIVEHKYKHWRRQWHDKEGW